MNLKFKKLRLVASTSKHDEDILDHSLTYGQAMRVKGKIKTLQIDLMTYDPEKIISSYEIKRGGGHHDSGKQEKIIEDLFIVRFTSKSYGEKIHRDLK